MSSIHSRQSRPLVILGLSMLAILVALAGCGTTSATGNGPANQPAVPTATNTVAPAPTATNTPSGPQAAVEIRSAGGYGNFGFSPASLTIKVGTTVVWTNSTSAPHTVTSATSAPDVIASDSIPNGGTFSFTFKKTGTYQYHCSIHPYMTGTIVVTS